MGCVTSYFSQKGQYDVSEKDETRNSKGKSKKEQGCDPALKEKDAQDDRRPIKKPTEPDEEGKEREDAALKIQTKYRQYQAKKTVEQIRNERDKTPNASDELQDSESGKPQSPTFDAHDPKLNEAATRIQAGVKGYLTRKELQTIKEGKKAKEGDVNKTEEPKSKDEGQSSLLGFQHQITSQLSDLQKQAEATKAELNQQIQAKATQMQESAKLAREQAEAKAAAAKLAAEAKTLEAKALAEEAKQAVQAKIEESTKAANQAKQTVVTTIDEKVELAKQSVEQAKQTANKEVENVKQVVGAKEAEVKEAITSTAATIKHSAEEVKADTAVKIAEVKQTSENKISQIQKTADEVVENVTKDIEETSHAADVKLTEMKTAANEAVLATESKLCKVDAAVSNVVADCADDVIANAECKSTEINKEIDNINTTLNTQTDEFKDSSTSKQKEISDVIEDKTSFVEKSLVNAAVEGVEVVNVLVNATKKEVQQDFNQMEKIVNQTIEIEKDEFQGLPESLHEDELQLEEPDFLNEVETPLILDQISANIKDISESDVAQNGKDLSMEEVICINGELEVKKKTDELSNKTKSINQQAVAKSSSCEFKEKAVASFSNLAHELESEVKEIKKNIKEKKKRNRRGKLDKPSDIKIQTKPIDTKNIVSTEELDSCLKLLQEQTKDITKQQNQLDVNLKKSLPLENQYLSLTEQNDNFPSQSDVRINDTATQEALIHIELLETEAELLKTEAELFEAEVEREALTDLGAQFNESSDRKLEDSISHQVEEKVSNIEAAAASQVSSLEEQLDSQLQNLKQESDTLIEAASEESEELRHLMAHNKKAAETAKHDFEAELESQLENLQQTQPVEALREEAATKIQAGFRGYKARQEVKAIVDNVSQETQRQAEEFDKAATKIQASFRGYRVRKEFNQGDRV